MKQRVAQLRQSASDWFSGLTQREQNLVGLFSGVIAIVFVLIFVVAGINGLASKREGIQRAESQIVQLKQMSKAYLSKKRDATKSAARLTRNTVSLFSLLQNVSTQLDLTLNDLHEKKNILSGEKVVEITVKVNLKKLSIDRLTAFIDAVESNPSGLVKVIQLKIKSRFDAPDLLDAQMTVATWKAV